MAVDQFSGNPQTEWLTEQGPDRRMQLLADFAYTDPQGKVWKAPTGAKIDGASIPAPLWSAVGSPYTGDYRRASIVHDVACDDPSIKRKDADEMFYNACLTGGCSIAQARLLYAGVRIGAWLPSIHLWSDAAQPVALDGGQVEPTLANASIQTTFREIAFDLRGQSDKMPFKDLAALVERHLKAKAKQSTPKAQVPQSTSKSKRPVKK